MASARLAPLVNQEMEASASAALRDSPYFFVRSVTCRCDADAVILEGEVPTFYQKQQAQEALSHLEEMLPVDNRIHVQGY